MTTEQSFNPHPVLRSRATVLHQKTLRGTDGNYQCSPSPTPKFVAKAPFGYSDASNEEQLLRRLDAAVKQTLAGAGTPSTQTVSNNILFRSAQPNYDADLLKQDEYDY